MKGKHRTTLALSLVLAFLAPRLFAADEARVLRFPAIHDDRIVFTFAGDLYSVPAQGGVARRLTTHEGFEIFARFSPDGKELAFTAEYDGNREVYRMPSGGGSPVRLTHTPTLSRDDVSDRMGPNNLVMGWTPDGKSILFRSRMREPNSFLGQLYLVPREGGMSRQLPLPRGGFASYSPDGTKLAYNRVFREFRTWKRYRGGMADDVWIHDFETRETRAVTEDPAQDIIPMWHGNRIYFLSDRTSKERMNLFVHDLDGGGTRQLTRFEEFDVKFPSIGPKAIVFEYGGYLYRFDLATEEHRRVPVTIADDAAGGRAEVIRVDDRVTGFDLSPHGKRALFVARGDLFTVPAKSGVTRNLTDTSGVHERDAVWSPDGRTIAYVSDRSGTEEIWIVDQDGSGEPEQITSTGDTYIYEILWSPDGSKILWSDKKLRLRYLDLESKEIVDVTRARAWEIRSFTWSPDSRWIAWSQAETDSLGRVYLYSVETRELRAVTEGWYDASGPAFSRDGKYLLFSSSRDFNPIYSSTEWNHAYQDMARLYLVTLSEETASPFAPENDEVEIDEEETESEEDGAKDPSGAEASAKDESAEGDEGIDVDLEGIADRLVGLPVPVGNYGGISSLEGRVFYFHNRSGDPSSRGLWVFDFESEKAKRVGSYNGYSVSADGKKMLLRQGENGFGIVSLPSGPVTLSDKLDLSGMIKRLDRREEWMQIFNEAWRQMRDFFYAPNMHGVNWEAMRLRYKPLAEAVRHRYDLTYVIGEMIGELNVGHAYVGGGDTPEVDKEMKVGLLGAELEKDPESGYFRIRRVLEGENWTRSRRSPLHALGVDAEAGDFILSVNGKSTRELNDIATVLVGTAGKPTLLELADEPKPEAAREAIVVPIEDEHALYYYNWVEENIEKVSAATDGRVGYIHIPDMGVNGLNEFVKHFYPQLRKEGLIIDVRGNGGGNVSPMIIERLLRVPVMFDVARNTAKGTDPSDLHYGPKVFLMNEFSASDGDIFPYRVKFHRVGPLIGKRSWGGVVGIRGSLPFVDGGTLNKPEFANYDVEGKNWVMEGYGVDPDIVVDNDPAREYDGVDDQLNKAIEVMRELLETEGKSIPDPPPYPEKD